MDSLSPPSSSDPGRGPLKAETCPALAALAKTNDQARHSEPITLLTQLRLRDGCLSRSSQVSETETSLAGAGSV